MPPVAEYDGELDPFTLGVASGDPIADSVVIWTRLAPDPLKGGGLGEDGQGTGQTGGEVWAGAVADGARRGERCAGANHVTAKGPLDQSGDLGHGVAAAGCVEQRSRQARGASPLILNGGAQE